MTRRTDCDISTWTTVLNKAAPAAIRWAEPSTLASPATLMLNSPGQYSPATAPIRRSQPLRDLRTPRCLVALNSKVRCPAPWVPAGRVMWSTITAPSSYATMRPPGERMMHANPALRAMRVASPMPLERRSRLLKATVGLRAR